MGGYRGWVMGDGHGIGLGLGLGWAMEKGIMKVMMEKMDKLLDGYEHRHSHGF
jgi:hypothetical protein